MLLFKKAATPMQLLQQAAFGVCAAADPSAQPCFKREVIIDLLEEVFQCISDQKVLKKYQTAFETWGMPLKRLQFCLMRVLSVIYQEVGLPVLTSEMIGPCLITQQSN